MTVTKNMQDWPALDPNVLGPLCEALEDDAADVLDEFLADTPRLRQQIVESLQQGDYPAVARLLHQLKSSSGALGGTRVQNLSMYAEGQALAGSEDEIHEACDLLLPAIDTLVEAIAGYRQKL